MTISVAVKNKKKSIALLEFLIACFFSFLVTPVLASTLFIVHNLGETNALIPVMERFDETDFQVLAFGPAWSKLKGRSSVKNVSERLQSLGVDESLTEEELKDLVREIGPKVLVTGMASTAQAQLANTFNHEVQKVVFYDNFDPLWTADHGIKEYLLPFYENLLPGKTYHLIVPGSSYLKGAVHLEKFKTSTVHPLGQPSLEEWEKIYKMTDQEAIRKSMGIPETHRVLLYAGGFDPKDEGQYRRDLEIFLKGVQLLDPKTLETLVVLVTYHPKTDGSIERDLVSAQGQPSIRLVEKGGYSTAQLSTIADGIVCFKSTVGAQAAYMEKPVLYVAGNYENFLTKGGIASLATTLEQVKAVVRSFLEKKDTNLSFSEALGIPKDSSEQLTGFIKSLL